MRKRRGSEGQQDVFVDAIGELLPREQFGRKVQCASGKEEVLDLHGRGQDSAQQCQLFQGDKCCPKRVAGGLGWSPRGCSRALGGCGMEKLPCHPAWAGLMESCLEQPTPARGVVSSDLFAFSLQDVSGRTGAVHYPCLENFPSPFMVMSPSLLQVFS